MKNPLKLKENAKNEGYRYFDSKIRHLPRNPNGTFNELADGFHNNDVDAFRHAYVSAIFAIEYGDRRADIFGRIQEFFSFDSTSNSDAESKMDLWNNAVGRKIGLKHRSHRKIGDEVKRAIERLDLILSPNDSRVYKGAGLIKLEGGKSVVVLDKDDRRKNILFFDVATTKVMNLEQFVSGIKENRYPDYALRKINGKLTPVSLPDDSIQNNLG